ncbi:MAG: hypothetical protein IKA32_08840 [Lentisphaeria bacterium]|nr:hypothetical protein [Lentisphaeria bacterium]
MSKKAIFAAAALLVSVLFFSGCVVIKEYAPQKEAVKIPQQEYALARQLLQAFIKNDAKTFVSLLPEETRSKFTEESFAASRKSVIESVGEPVAYSYITTLELAGFHPQIWKVRFRRYNVNRTKTFYSEVLFKVVTGMADKKYAVITGFSFQ